MGRVFVSMEPNEFGFSWVEPKTHWGAPVLNFAYTGDKFVPLLDVCLSWQDVCRVECRLHKDGSGYHVGLRCGQCWSCRKWKEVDPGLNPVVHQTWRGIVLMFCCRFWWNGFCLREMIWSSRVLMMWCRNKFLEREWADRGLHSQMPHWNQEAEVQSASLSPVQVQRHCRL